MKALRFENNQLNLAEIEKPFVEERSVGARRQIGNLQYRSRNRARLCGIFGNYRTRICRCCRKSAMIKI